MTNSEKMYWAKDLKFALGFSLVGIICLAFIGLGVSMFFWTSLFLLFAPPFVGGFLLANNLSNNNERFTNIFNNAILMGIFYGAIIGIIPFLGIITQLLGKILDSHSALLQPINWISLLGLFSLMVVSPLVGGLIFIFIKKLFLKIS